MNNINKNINEKGGVPRTKSLTSKKNIKFRNPKGPAKYFHSYKNLQEIDLNSIKLPKKYVHETLNQDVWNDDELDNEVLQTLKKIAIDFYEFLKIDAPIEDIWFTGSLANYNWSDYSDIDLHVLIDFDKINGIEYEFLKEYFDAKKNVWNNNHNINIKDFEVELYAQDSNEIHTSTGVFSILNNEWIKKPNPLDPQIDRELLKYKIQKIVNKIEEIDKITDLEKIQERSKILKDKIKKMRQSGLDRGGEFSEENLAFKYLRNNGYIEKLFNKKRDAYDKSVSIDENEEPERTINYDEENNLVSSDEIVDIVMSLHTREEDFEDGDLIERIKYFPFYELKNVPLSSLDTDEFMTDDELVDKYAEEIKLNPDYPPIVFDPVNSSIIDGMHRVQSLEQLGYDTVRAYVGRSEDIINEIYLRSFIKHNIEEMFSAKGFHASMEDWIDKWKLKGIEFSNLYNEKGLDMGYKRKGVISENEDKINLKHKIYLEKNIKEEHDKNMDSLKEFILFCCNNGKIKHPTSIYLRGTRDENLTTTASYNPNNHNIHIYCKGRHIVDIMRSIAHELMHMIQMLENRLYDNSGEDGSPEENEAHSFSGLMIRKFGKLTPAIYENYNFKKKILK